jgi:hypothetical protein
VVQRYVIVGPLLEARVWARARGIGYGSVDSVLRPNSAFKLRGLTGVGVAVVRLTGARGPYVGSRDVEDCVLRLLGGGALQLPPDWRPGRPAPAGEPDDFELMLSVRPAPPAAG